MNIILGSIEVLGSLGVFFFGIKVMSDAIIKIKAEKLHQAITAVTRSPIRGIITGALITGLIQSSSATTVLVVSFVNTRLMKLREAVGVIMGANLGTTFTFWLVAILGFKVKASLLYMPALALGAPILFLARGRHKQWGEALIGFGLLFMGLDLLKVAVPDIKSNPDILAFLARYTDFGFGSLLLFVLVGIALTLIVQSSSSAGAVVLLMAYRGWIDFPTAAAIIMGGNIGTTITAHLAAMNASAAAKRAARAHFLFNVLGVVWMLPIFPWFLGIAEFLTPGPLNDPSLIPQHLAAFHTLFNLANILLLIGFVTPLIRIATRMVPDDPPETRKPESLILEQAHGQIQIMIEVINQMFVGFRQTLSNPGLTLHERIESIHQQEYQTDRIQVEVAEALQQHSSTLVAQQVWLALADLRIIDQLESIADRILELVRRLEKKKRKSIDLPPLFEVALEDKVVFIADYLSCITQSLSQTDFSGDRECMQRMSAQFKELRELPRDIAWKSDSSQHLAKALWKNLIKIGDSCTMINRTIQGDYHKLNLPSPSALP